jgi:hypothetical protein
LVDNVLHVLNLRKNKISQIINKGDENHIVLFAKRMCKIITIDIHNQETTSECPQVGKLFPIGVSDVNN